MLHSFVIAAMRRIERLSTLRLLLYSERVYCRKEMVRERERDKERERETERERGGREIVCEREKKIEIEAGRNS